MELKRAAKLYLSGAIIYLLGILIFNYLPYYERILSVLTQKILILIYILYLIIAPIYYLISKQMIENKPYLVFQGIKKIITFKRLEKKEKVAFLFMLVKIFFLPLMINFFLGNINSLLDMRNDFYLYPFVLTLIFTLDTLVFGFGYAVEFPKLKNVVKSVEPTIFGWIVALICYPPFNSYVGKYIPWGANDYVTFWGPIGTDIFRTLIILLLVIYLLATFALGFKASNLTNRGIVTKFPYSIVRHPAYISKVLTWWLAILPVINWKFALGMLFWTVIYFFRGITEERHLKQDPDYVAYCKKVKWKFIPWIY